MSLCYKNQQSTSNPFYLLWPQRMPNTRPSQAHWSILLLIVKSMGRHGRNTHAPFSCFTALGSWKVGQGARPQKQLLPSGTIPTWILFPRKEREWRRAKSQKGISPALEFSLHEKEYKYRAYRHNLQILQVCFIQITTAFLTFNDNLTLCKNWVSFRFYGSFSFVNRSLL